MRSLRIAGLTAILGMAGCGDGTPSYAPPTAPGARLCVAQCEKARGYCAESCDLDFRACYADMQRGAQQAYDLYARQMRATRRAADRTPADFENRASCDPGKKSCTDACTGDYNSCFTTCGGTVSP